MLGRPGRGRRRRCPAAPGRARARHRLRPRLAAAVRRRQRGPDGPGRHGDGRAPGRHRLPAGRGRRRGRHRPAVRTVPADHLRRRPAPAAVRRRPAAPRRHHAAPGPGRGAGTAAGLAVAGDHRQGRVHVHVRLEGIGFAFYLTRGFDRHRRGRARASLITATFSKLSGAFLLLGLLLLGRTPTPWSWRLHRRAAGTRTQHNVLLIIGFAVKVGLAPVQIWLPAGYSAAPGPARAVLAGAAVNVGFYGLWRTLQLLGAPPRWLAVVLLLVAAASALLGIAHVAVQDRLSRVIAFSSVENAGLITTGYAVALIGAAVHQPLLTAIGLLAATLQVVTHAMAKTLLFTTSHRLGHGFGTDLLDDLRGTVRTLPVSSTGFAIGCLTLAGLPLTCGLVSEWMLLEALLQQFRVPFLAARLAMAAAGALVALTAGFAGVAFVRLVGLTVLGSPPSKPLAGARDPGLPVRAIIIATASGCFALAAIAPWRSASWPPDWPRWSHEPTRCPPCADRGCCNPSTPTSPSSRPPGSGSSCPCSPPRSPPPCSCSPADGHCGSAASLPGARPPAASRAPTGTPPTATPTPPAASWPASCTPAPP
ncbi:hypothetical protein GXW82_33125 [Streptacidiphilus sp. 4-A2]|nr:hypothetical protein [Streptacidiphilus sp. 4-A2]